MWTDMKIVEFGTYPNEIEAHLVGQILQDEKIPIVLKPLGTGYGGFGVTQWIHHRIYVPEDDLDRARKIIASTQIIPDEVDVEP